MDGRRLFFVLIVGLGISGCATTYQRGGFTGGFDEHKVNDSAYVVSFRGNGYASSERVWYFWIYRCAELTQQNGYQLFTIRAPQAPTAALPGNFPSLAPDDAGDSDSGFVKVAAHYTAPTIITVPGSRGASKWTSSGTVLMFHAPLPEEVLWTLNAQNVLDQLRPYVTSNGKVAPPSRTNLYKQALVAHVRIDLGDGMKVGPVSALPLAPPAASSSQPAAVPVSVSAAQPRSVEDVQSNIDIARFLALHAIYREHVLRGMDATSGRVVLAFTVTSAGMVKDIRVVSSSFSDRVFISELSNLIRLTPFGVRNVSDTRVTDFPISFAPVSAL